MKTFTPLSRRCLALMFWAVSLSSCQSTEVLASVSPSPLSPAMTPLVSPSPEEPTLPVPDLATPSPEMTPTPQLSTAQTTPLAGPWSVSFKVTRDAGTSYYSGASVKVDSEGAVENATWQNGIVAPTPHVQKSQLAPEAVAALAKAMADPALQTSALAGGRGVVELTLTIQGKTTTLLSETDTLSGAAGRLVQALNRVAPVPKLKLDKTMPVPQSR